MRKEIVIFGAAKKAGILPRFLPGHAAIGAAGGGGIRNLGVAFEELIEEFVDRDVGLLDGVAGFLGAGFTEVDVVRLAVGDLDHMNGCGFIASFAEVELHVGSLFGRPFLLSAGIAGIPVANRRHMVLPSTPLV